MSGKMVTFGGRLTTSCNCALCGVQIIPVKPFTIPDDVKPVCIPCGFDEHNYSVSLEGRIVSEDYKAREKAYATMVWGCGAFRTDMLPFMIASNRINDHEPDVLSLVAAGKAWKIPYSKLERHINGGYVNALGTALTDKGKAAL